MNWRTASVAGAEELLFVPLGGVGEIGMNMNCYGHHGKWIIIDCGITFGTDADAGIEIFMPDPSFITERSDDLLALVLTHAHEDHIGAIPYLWPLLRCPIYATPFTRGVIEHKLKGEGLVPSGPFHDLSKSKEIAIGPFKIRPVCLTHSIPEQQALIVTTKLGHVLHTGDWKLDPGPVVGPVSDEKGLKELGEAAPLAMVCDSTNVFEEGYAGSEAKVKENLKQVFSGQKGRLLVGAFSSNVARLASIATTAREVGRKVALVGRSLWRMQETARKHGYLRDIEPFLTPQEGMALSRSKVLFICTGSQGESRAALMQIARKTHSHVRLEEGDVVVFSSRKIPGNELRIGRLQNLLALASIDCVVPRDDDVHVSGHPNREELRQIYSWVRPQLSVAVHGEPRHLREHGKLARELGIASAPLLENGDMLQLTLDEAGVVSAKKIDSIPNGRWGIDGTKFLIPSDHVSIADRRKLHVYGLVLVHLVLEAEDSVLASPPAVEGLGLPVFDLQDLCDKLGDEITRFLEKTQPEHKKSDTFLCEKVSKLVTTQCRNDFGKRPVVRVTVSRL